MNVNNSQEQINKRVQDGQDLVFAERHTVTADTFRYMAQTITDTEMVGAVSLEYPPEAQTVLDEASAGTIDKSVFMKELVLSQTQAVLHTAKSMLTANMIGEDDFAQASALIDKRIGTIIDADFSDPMHDESSPAALYDLVQIAASQGTLVLANDRDINFAVLKLLAPRMPDIDIDLEDFVSRLNDRTDFELLTSQIDFNTVGSVLVHRGANHTHDIQGHSTGMDDFLFRHGRTVSVVGHYRCFGGIADAFTNLAHMGVTRIDDPTDHTIVGGQWYDQSDLSLFEGLMEARRAFGNGPIVM